MFKTFIHHKRFAFKHYNFITSISLMLLLFAPFYTSLGQSRLDMVREIFDSARQLEDAEQTLIETEEKQGSDSPQLIVPLIDLADIEVKSRNWSNAFDHTSRALEILEITPDRTSELHALVLRTDAYAGMRKYRLARDDAFDALKLNKKIKPVNRHQESMIHGRLVDIAIAQGDWRDGNYHAKAMIKSDKAHFKKNHHKEYVTTLLHAVDWYRYSSQFGKERKFLRQSVELTESLYGENDSRLAMMLRRIAQSCMYAHEDADEGEAALRRAMQLDFATPAEATNNQALLTTELADHLVVFRDPATATQLYEQAWNLIADDPGGGTEMANLSFDKVRQLYYRMPSSPGAGIGVEVYVLEGFAQVEFTVTARGTVEDVIIVDSQRGINGAHMIRAYEKARYRPRVIDGKAIPTPNVRHRTTYSTIPGIPRDR